MADALKRTLALAVLAAVTLAWVVAPPANAQDAPPSKKDKELDDLLDKFESKAKDGEKSEDKAAEKKDAPKKKEEAKPEPKKSDGAPKSGDKPAPAPATKGKGEVSGKDKTIDDLLEKLGGSEDKPAPDDKRPAPDDADTPKDTDKDKDQGQGDGKSKPPKKGADPLTGKDKQIDEALEGMTGKVKKPKGDEGKSGGGGGPMEKLVKEMRDVEGRLGQPDTGEETRKRQQEIVKNLETLIEQARASQGQSKSKKVQKQVAGMKPGRQQPNGPNSESPNPDGGNAPHQKPMKPENSGKHPAGGKDAAWGHLPPELRELMENVFTEDFLPRKRDKINNYFLDLTKKTVTRNRGE